MKAVVIGESSGATLEVIMSVYPRHKLIADKFIERGDVIRIGPFSDSGNMAIFRTRAAAEEWVKEDPFILEGLIVYLARRYCTGHWITSPETFAACKGK